MKDSEPGQAGMGRHSVGDLVSAAIVMLVYFAFMLAIAFGPALLAAPVAQGSKISVGLASGVLMAVFMVVFSALYTHRRNSREADGQTFDTRA